MWNISIHNKNYGPYNKTEMETYIREGRITKDTLIWTEGMKNWEKAGKVNEFSNMFKGSGMKKWKLPLAIVLGGLILIVVIIAFIPSNKKGLKLGTSKEILKNVVSTNGGIIEIKDSDSEINGLKLSVPKGAYDRDIEYQIKTTEIKEQYFGENFNAVTPLITINNGHEFANQAMVVSIPINKTDDEIAMAFFYDEETKELEGIPFIEQSNSEIKVITSHFSNIVVSKIKKGRIVEDIDTGFTPGKDDFQVANYGSALCYGHCAGQSIAEIYYYNNKGRVGFEKNLNGLLDNDMVNKTPGFWQDDSLVLRLSSVVQLNEENRWNNDSSLNDYKRAIGADDEATYYAFAYSMSITNKPQFVYISGLDSKNVQSAHAIVAYRVTKDAIYVADPNKPGEERKIEFVRTKDKKYFKPYGSGANANDIGKNDTSYTGFGYFGVSALVDMGKVSDSFHQALENKTVGSNVFPKDALLTVTYLNLSGTASTIPLVKNTNVTSSEIELMGFLAAEDKVYIFKGIDIKAALKDGTCKITLDEGKNDIGVFHCKIVNGEEKYVNFIRYNINYSKEEIKPEGNTTGTDGTTGINDDKTDEKNIDEKLVDKLEDNSKASREDNFDYQGALAKWAADYAAEVNSRKYDDGVCKSTTEFEWVKAPFIQGDQVLGASRIWQTNTFYAGELAGRTTRNTVNEAFTEGNPGMYIYTSELREKYPQFKKN